MKPATFILGAELNTYELSQGPMRTYSSINGIPRGHVRGGNTLTVICRINDGPVLLSWVSSAGEDITTGIEGLSK